MRDDEIRLLDRLLAVEEEVEVDRSGPPAGADPLPPQPALEVEQVDEELARRECGLDLGSGIQELRLIRVSPRLGLEKRREPAGAECVS